MAVSYRGQWQSSGRNAEALLASRTAVTRWVTGDADSAGLPDGEHDFGGRSVRVRGVADGDANAFEAVVIDHRQVGEVSTVWRTTIGVISSNESTSTRVQLEMETDQPIARETIGRPRVVSDLLALADSPFYGTTNVWLEEREFGVEEVSELIRILTDETRALPFIVFSEPPAWASLDWRNAAGKATRRVQGVANVVLLGNDAVSVFKTALGALSVWGGGVRTYVPGPLDGPADAWRHRYIPARQLAESPAASVDRIVSAVCQLSARRRMPAEFSILDRWSTESATDDLDAVHLELDMARDELDESAAELARVTGRYGRLVDTLRLAGLDSYVWETHDEPEGDDKLPDSAQDMSDAVLNAQHYFAETVFLPDAAHAELDALDTAPNRSAWGNTAWRGFRALNAYAMARRGGFQGGFWAWCERGEVDAWPATKKKLSMSESDTVQNSEKLSAARLMPVDKRVDESGQVQMLAHLKIAEGGGRLAPRIYFYDDTGGTTKAIHVGFVGPHYLVPNTKA